VTTPGSFTTAAQSTGSAAAAIPTPVPTTLGGTGVNAATNAALLADIGSMAIQASTPVGGTALINGTQNFISWTAPNDGKLHRFQIFGGESVTSAQTGGSVNVTFTGPDGSAQNITILGPALATGYSLIDAAYQAMSLCEAATTVTIVQATAQTAGAAKLYAEIWGL
jgi:hypothetical protein